jgi:hypothetical protein
LEGSRALYRIFPESNLHYPNGHHSGLPSRTQIDDYLEQNQWLTMPPPLLAAARLAKESIRPAHPIASNVIHSLPHSAGGLFPVSVRYSLDFGVCGTCIPAHASQRNSEKELPQDVQCRGRIEEVPGWEFQLPEEILC